MTGVPKRRPASAAAWILLPVLLFVFSGCTPRQMAVREMTGILQSGAARLEQDDDLELIEAALPANIKLLESLLAESPGDPQIHVLLARLYGSYAFAFAERDLEAAELLPGQAPVPVRAESLKDRVRGY